MRTLLVMLVGTLAFGAAVGAEVEPVAVRVPQATAWIGQRVLFYVELRAPGSFQGTAAFDLPQLPGTLLMKIGNPVVTSQDLEGQSWFVQVHEFALFSQKPGILEVPAFWVRFTGREGFTGPARDVQAQAPAWKVDLQRPPGTENLGFLITTESLEVTETWEPQPGPAQVGGVFKRTIVQRASLLSGMALAPAPATVPEPIRVYAGHPRVNDRTERGQFLGERLETITYLLQKPGTFTVPALTYVWWDPKGEALQSKTLPAVTFDVAPPSAPMRAAGDGIGRHAWSWLLAMVSAVGLLTWQRRRLLAWVNRFWRTLNPPERVLERKLLRACRQHDAASAESAWIAWRHRQGASFQPGPELRSAVLGLQRHLFGPAQEGSWQGDELALAFGRTFAAGKARFSRKPSPALPPLNP